MRPRAADSRPYRVSFIFGHEERGLIPKFKQFVDWNL